MFNVKQILGCVATLAIVSLPTQASQLVLDSFNYAPAIELQATPALGSQVINTTAQSAESGAFADYTLTWLSGQGTESLDANAFGSGSLSYGEGPLVDGTLNIDYSLPGGTPIDFTGYSDVYFDVLAIDGSGGFDVMLTLQDSDGTLISASYNVSSTGMFLASFASMMPGPDFDFSLVQSLSAFITSDGNGDDFSLDSVGLVPEPSALAILGLGLIGLGLRRRKLV